MTHNKLNYLKKLNAKARRRKETKELDGYI